MSKPLKAGDQGDLFGGAPSPAGPPGFRAWSEVIAPDAEAILAARLADLPFAPYDFHGHLGKRRVVSFGGRYDAGAGAAAAAPPLPDFLVALRRRVAVLAGAPPDDFVQALINEYAPGAGIGWHRDRPEFGLVAGVSLLAPCVLRFRRSVGEGRERASVPLAPRSAYLLAGAARHRWQHSIAPMAALRYSITFRTLARP
jgi:alkylated DNA repair dioxygenase AlkB